MENSSDSYNSSSSTSSQFAAYQQCLEENRPKTTTSSFYSSLHAVRKLPLKPMKKPIAPLPPMKPKVYKVDSVNFKQVVQRLTSAPEFQPNVSPAPEAQEVVEKVPTALALRPRRLEEVAPPALDLSSTASPLRFSSTTQLSVPPGTAAGNDHNAAGQGRWGGQHFLPSPNNTSQIPANFSELIASERKHHKFSETCGAPSPLGFSFSPSSMAWCLSPLLSPGTLSFLD
ncbi:unnamed protein product [Coffea canephora]|uniref:VQ domain-containing protein n=1 Tax=Coffea canephora TaxID=49390 RepID=A0A068U4U1_COFCA|nr:unnamed protein product [Coffea canephora]